MKKITLIISIFALFLFSIFLSGCDKTPVASPVCDFVKDVECVNMQYSDNAFFLDVKNVMSQDITSLSINLDACEQKSPTVGLQEGETKTFKFPCKISRGTFESKVFVNYVDSEKGLKYLKVGQLVYDTRYKE